MTCDVDMFTLKSAWKQKHMYMYVKMGFYQVPIINYISGEGRK